MRNGSRVDELGVAEAVSDLLAACVCIARRPRRARPALSAAARQDRQDRVLDGGLAHAAARRPHARTTTRASSSSCSIRRPSTAASSRPSRATRTRKVLRTHRRHAAQRDRPRFLLRRLAGSRARPRCSTRCTRSRRRSCSVRSTQHTTEFNDNQLAYQQQFLAQAGRPAGYLALEYDPGHIVRRTSPPLAESPFQESFARQIAIAAGAPLARARRRRRSRCASPGCVGPNHDTEPFLTRLRQGAAAGRRPTRAAPSSPSASRATSC